MGLIFLYFTLTETSLTEIYVCLHNLSYIERDIFAITITQLLGQQHWLVSFTTFRCPEDLVNGSKSNY